MNSITEIKKLSPSSIDNDKIMRKINASTGSDSGRIHMIPTSCIFPNPNQPRKTFDDNSLMRLADSIRKFGFIHPVTVRRMDSPAENPIYEIVVGERRLRAAMMLKMDTVPCLIVRSDTRRCAELALIENIQRDELNFFEQAGAISALIEIYRLTQEDIAGRLSVSQSYIANKLRLLKYTQLEREKILAYGFTERHARSILRIDSLDLRLAAIEYVHDHALNVASTEAYIEKLLTSVDDECADCVTRKVVLKDIRIFYNTIEKAVSIVRQAGINIEANRSDDSDGCSVMTIRIPNIFDVSRET